MQLAKDRITKFVEKQTDCAKAAEVLLTEIDNISREITQRKSCNVPAMRSVR